MLFVVPVVLFDMLKAKQLACVSESGQKCPAARSLSLRRAWIEIYSQGEPWQNAKSLSLRRAWIEMCCLLAIVFVGSSRSPYGERGLKLFFGHARCERGCRSPYGERGLKFQMTNVLGDEACRSPYGERGLKSNERENGADFRESLSLRRAWIEISINHAVSTRMKVALLTESVD